MTTQEDDTPSNLRQFALEKMAKVLGADRARHLLDQLLAQHTVELRTPEDLLRLSEAMSRLGGIEAAVGAMLGVSAVLRGARTPA